MGEVLLIDAIERALAANHVVAIHSILVDAKDGPASAFYVRYGFRRFPSRPSRMFLLASEVSKAFA